MVLCHGGRVTAPPAIEVHRDVSSAGVRLRTTEWRAPDTDHEATAAVIILPGVLSPRASFKEMAECMVPEFRVIAVDLPGFGESEKHSPARYRYGITSFAEAIADLFGGLGLAQAHVLGHGVGGATALKLAAHHPELVKRLALIAPIVHPPRINRGEQLLLAPVIGGLFFRQMLGKTWFHQIYRDRVNPGVSAQALNHYYESISSPATRAALLATLRACTDGSSVIADSRRVRAQTLLLWGLEDKLLPIELGRSLSREMPQAGLEIMRSHHAPHEELPVETAKVLSDFYSGRRAGFST